MDEELQDFAIDLKEILSQFEDSIINCSQCGLVLACPKCGNNACNGGYGEIDGKQCDLCPASYAIMAQLNR